jgi:hypothetical protein
MLAKKLVKEIEALPSDRLSEIEALIKALKIKKTHKRPAGEKPYSVFDEIDEVATDVGVRDLARNHDHYLYGAPKR